MIFNAFRTIYLVGVARLELAASWSRTMRATICATPRNSFLIIRALGPLVKNLFSKGISPSPRKYNSDMKASSEKNLKLLLSCGVFILLTAAKLLFPEQTAPARDALHELIAHDADYMAAFRGIGQGLSSDGAVTQALYLLTGHDGSDGTEALYVPETTLRDQIEDSASLLPKVTPEPSAVPSPTPEPEPTPEPTPTPEPVPEAVTAFLEAQAEFADYDVPANVSYGYPDLPFDYVSPVAGMTSSGFGYRLHPLKNEVLFHYGTDFAAWTGTEILAFAEGTVGMVGWDAGFGNYIIVQHAGGWRTLYAHCSAVYVTGGDTVTAGECIGLVGATGNVTGPHLHLELTCDGVYYNPEFWLT